MYVWIGVNVWLDGLWWLVRGGGGQKIEILLPESPKKHPCFLPKIHQLPPGNNTNKVITPHPHLPI